MFTRNMMPTHKHCNENKGNRNPTLEEIQRAINAYDKIGDVFDPRISNKGMKTKPFVAYIYELKDAA